MDVIFLAIRHDEVEIVALTVPQDRIKNRHVCVIQKL